VTDAAADRSPAVIAFDVDGVLVHPHDDHGRAWHNELSDDFGIPQPEVERFFANDWGPCIVGAADLYDVLPPYLERWGFAGGVADFLDYWFEHDCRLDADLMAAIGRLPDDVCLVLATNQERHRTQYLWEHLGLSDRFEHMFSSALLGACKPSHAFWHEITTTLRPAHRGDILLIDDSAANVAAARDFGWQAIHYRDMSDLDGLFADKTREPT
jgi:putative hydrolase of the HAD superfamily